MPDMPLPRFAVGDKVFYSPENIGVIVGMRYTSLFPAIKTGAPVGWSYTVDWTMGKTVEEAIALSEFTTEDIGGDKLVHLTD